MSGLSEKKIIVITRRTRVDDLIRKFNNTAQASFYIEKMGGNFSEYIEESNVYKKAVKDSVNSLEEFTRVQVIERDFVPNFMFGKDDIVVVIGQDGLVANTIKYLDGQPLIAVNPDPVRNEGILLPFKVPDVRHVAREVIQGTRKQKEITMASAVLNDGQSILAVNDLFIGRKSHVSARYSIRIGKSEENQSSSGIIISTGLGSTGWLKSLIAGASGLTSAITGHSVDSYFEYPSWDSRYLYYSVREPFPSKTTGIQMVFAKITREPLIIKSQMPEGGVIFSDGIEQDFLQFNSGIEVKISVSAKKGYLVV